MLSAAARSGLAPPKLRPFDAAQHSSLCSAPSPVISGARRRRAESERRRKEKKSLTTTALGSSSDDDARLGGNLANLKKEKTQAVLDERDFPTQEAAYEALARIALDLLDRNEKKKRVVVGLAGGPGSGKSTTAAAVVEKVNALWRRQRGKEDEEGEEEDIAAVLPMDGFHLTREQLAASVDPSPEEMFARRGAPWTFDGEAFVEKVKEVVEAGSEEEKGKAVALAPSFDHGVGDPVPRGVIIKPEHRFVLVEGNYLLLPQEPWSRLVGGGEGEKENSSSPSLFDQTWFLDVGVDEAMQRVRQRQVADGVPEEISRARVETNDRPNGEMVAATRGRADLVVRGDLPLSNESSEKRK